MSVLGRLFGVGARRVSLRPTLTERLRGRAEIARRNSIPGPDAPRAAHRVHAATFGYFWLPCPVCTEPFGGHEWDSECVPSYDDDGQFRGSGTGICPKCSAAGVGKAYRDMVNARHAVTTFRAEPHRHDLAEIRAKANPRMTEEEVEEWLILGYDPSHMCGSCGRPMLMHDDGGWSCANGDEHRRHDAAGVRFCLTCGMEVEDGRPCDHGRTP